MTENKVYKGLFIQIQLLLGWCMRGWVSSQCERNTFQYSRVAVPILAAASCAAHPQRDSYSDGTIVAVRFQSAAQTEQQLASNRYRKSQLELGRVGPTGPARV